MKETIFFFIRYMVNLSIHLFFVLKERKINKTRERWKEAEVLIL